MGYYLFYVVLINQASYYKITAEFFINHINNKSDWGNNVSEALWTLVKSDTEIWEPTINISSNMDAIIKEIEDNQFAMEYKEELDWSMRINTTYEDNAYKFYTLLWEICAK